MVMRAFKISLRYLSRDYGLSSPGMKKLVESLTKSIQILQSLRYVFAVSVFKCAEGFDDFLK